MAARWLKRFLLLHQRWREAPVRTATVAFCLALLATALSATLGVFWSFGNPPAKGYFQEVAWGPLYLTAFPLAVVLVGWLLQVIRDSVTSLDGILIRVTGNRFLFSSAALYRFDERWAARLLPALAALTILLVLGLDAGPIFAPYMGHRLPWQWPDWATVGAARHADRSPMIYLLFNLYAYSLEMWLIYSGLLVLVGAACPLLTVLNQGLQEVPPDKRGALPSTLQDVDFARHYETKWDYTDPTGRCGLGKFDRVFFIFALIVIVGFGLALLVSRFDESNNGGTMTIGGAVLAHGAFFLLLVFAVVVLYPYYRHFPNELPVRDDLPYELRAVTLPKPQPWPLGHMALSLGIVSMITGEAALLGRSVLHFWGVLRTSPFPTRSPRSAPMLDRASQTVTCRDERTGSA